MNRNFGLINISSGGFFPNFFVSLSTAMDVEKNNLIPYIELNNTVFANYNDVKNINTYNWWFEQQIPNDFDSKVNFNQNNDNFYKFPAPFGNNKWNRKDIEESKNFFYKYFKIKEHILLQVNSYYDIYLKDKINVGVMARGTEFNTIHPQYGNHSVYTYIDSVKKILLEYKIDNIFLVTEDGDFLTSFKNEFNNLLYMDVFRRTTQSLQYCKSNWKWCYENNRPNHTKILGDECMIQSLLLGKCDYLICKYNSFSAGAILFNDNLKNVYYV